MDRKAGQRTWPLFGHVLCPIYVSFHLECTPLFLLIDNLRFYRGGPGYRSTLVHFFVNAAPLRDQYDTFPAGYTWCNAFPALFSIVLHSGSHAYPLYMIYYGCYNGHNVWLLFGHTERKPAPVSDKIAFVSYRVDDAILLFRWKQTNIFKKFRYLIFCTNVCCCFIMVSSAIGALRGAALDETCGFALQWH